MEGLGSHHFTWQGLTTGLGSIRQGMGSGLVAFRASATLPQSSALRNGSKTAKRWGAILMAAGMFGVSNTIPK